MSTLYDISADYVQISDMLGETDSEQEIEQLSDKLNAIDVDFNDKVKNIVYMISEIKEQCSSIGSELKRLADRKQRKEKIIEKLQDYVKKEMEYVGKDKVETPTHTIKVRKSTKTEIEPMFIEWAINSGKSDYLNKKVSYIPNKKLIKEDIENHNLECPYARLVNNTNLLIN